MTLIVKLFASLRKFLPEGAQQGKATIEFPDGATLRTVIEQLHIPPAMCHLTMINGAHEKDLDSPIEDGAEVSIFPPVAGGQ